MKAIFFIFSLKKTRPLLLIFLFFLSTFYGKAQDDDMFIIVEYMKTTPGKEWNYVELEQNFWKQVHHERVKNGEIIAWLLYRIRYTASADPYNYATVTIFNNPDKLEHPGSVDPVTVHPDKDVESVYADTEESRDLVTRNLLMRQNFIQMPEGSPGQKFIEVDYMKVSPGQDGDYLTLEDKVWKPIHQQFINSGTRAGWSLWGRIYPSGYGMDYQYIAVNYFSEFSQIGQADYEAAIKVAHPGKDVNEIGVETNNSRELVRSELWELLDIVH